MDEPAHYEIRIAEQFDERVAKWFGDLEIISDVKSDEMILHGEIVDQTALFGVLGKIRDLGLTLSSVQRLERNANEHTTHGDDSQGIYSHHSGSGDVHHDASLPGHLCPAVCTYRGRDG